MAILTYAQREARRQALSEISKITPVPVTPQPQIPAPKDKPIVPPAKKKKVAKKAKSKAPVAKIPLTHRRQDNNKRLTDAEKLMISAERHISGKPMTTIAKDYGVSIATVHTISHDDGIKTKLALAEGIKRGLSADCLITADQGIRNTQSKMDALNAYQSAIVAATMIDKHLAIEGLSRPQIDIHIDMASLDKLQSRKEELRAMMSEIDVTP